MATWISKHMGAFTYFDHRLGNPDWTGKRVLDFGGNVGNFLLDPSCAVKPANYWSIDISRDAITEGRRRHPEAHFVFYDRYHYEYNPIGIVGSPIPDLGVQFDVIVAWSVFTHNNEAETLEIIDQLLALLTDEGQFLFTFIDPLWTPPPGWSDESESTSWSNLRWMLEKLRANKPDMDVAGLLAQAGKAKLTWVTLVDSDQLVVGQDNAGIPPENPKAAVHHRQWAYINMCTAEYMSRLLPNAHIGAPALSNRQHCAILDARKGTGR
jgi:SAM-dependent methyltransferase